MTYFIKNYKNYLYKQQPNGKSSVGHWWFTRHGTCERY